ncbi:hypothetical protein [Archangium sp.]|uniref:hypothetical protein n=1 Tax=Archangium sp. TaxID=1872627 RepID=UPI002D45B4B4|nr:hypothetical protein [Archangium sp.]HYO54000.1 hypothetical protein [Archangium sp.]
MEKKNRTLVHGRSPVTKHGVVSVLMTLVALVLLGGCATGHPRGSLLRGTGLHSWQSAAGGFPMQKADASPVEGSEMPVQRVRLIYEGGDLMPENPATLRAAVKAVEKAAPGVEVLFQ